MTSTFATIFALVALLLCAANWHVRTSAELAAALTNPDVQPGDVVLLHSGTYRGTFKPTLQGTPDKPITIRSAPGEWAIVDGSRAGEAVKFVNVIDIAAGGWVTFRDFEVTNSDPERTITETGSNPFTARGTGVSVRAPGIVLDGLVVHDCGNGIGSWSGGTQSSVRNCAIYNNGWWAADRGHGHGLYAQAADERLFEGNVIGPQFDYTVHAYGSDEAKLDHFRFVRNVVQGGALIGGSCPVNDLVLDGNIFTRGAAVGWGDWITSRDIRVTNNTFLDVLYLKYIADGTLVAADNRFPLLDAPKACAIGLLPPRDGQLRYTFSGNAYWRSNDGYVWSIPGQFTTWPDWRARGFDLDGSHTNRSPDATEDQVITFGTDPNRRIVAVLNFSGQPAVYVALPWINMGDRYRIRHALNWHAVAADGECSGQPVSLPIGTADSVAVPIGWDKRLIEPDVRFGVFAVERMQESDK